MRWIDIDGSMWSLDVLEPKDLVLQVLTLGCFVLHFKGVVEGCSIVSDHRWVEGLNDVPGGECVDQHECNEPKFAQISSEDVSMVHEVGSEENKCHLQVSCLWIINILCNP